MEFELLWVIKLMNKITALRDKNVSWSKILVDKKKRMQDDAVGKKIITLRAVIKYEYVW